MPGEVIDAVKIRDRVDSVLGCDGPPRLPPGSTSRVWVCSVGGGECLSG